MVNGPGGPAAENVDLDDAFMAVDGAEFLWRLQGSNEPA